MKNKEILICDGVRMVQSKISPNILSHSFHLDIQIVLQQHK